jgi:competence protein ComEA
MDTSAPWRALEVPEVEADGAGRTAEGPTLLGRHLLLAVAGGLAIAALTAAVLVASQTGAGPIEVLPAASGTGATATTAPPEPMLIVEVAGAVVRPGVYSLPVGSRVGDAIAAAGGYSPDVDPRQAETQLNLAAKLLDAELIHVPRRGESPSPGSPGSTTHGTPGLVNLNTATAEELDTLPGVGPATAQKIIAAREQQPFRAVDELLSRKIVSASTLAKLRALVTV